MTTPQKKELSPRSEKRRSACYDTGNTSGDILTRQQVAEYLKVCRNKVDALPIPKLRLGRSVRYRKTDVDAWLEVQIAQAGGSHAKNAQNEGARNE
jgi:excisionase family DNA binding protein